MSGARYIVAMVVLCVFLLTAWLAWDATFARLRDPGKCGSTPSTAPPECWQKYAR